jgi:hypothetical protein
MRRLLVPLVAVLSVAFAAALIARSGAASSVPRFRTPDAGAACRLEGTALVCSSLGSPGSVALRAGRTAVVRQLPWWDASTRVLHAWRRGGVTCRLAGGAILCRTGAVAIRVAADGFSVAR